MKYGKYIMSVVILSLLFLMAFSTASMNAKTTDSLKKDFVKKDPLIKIERQIESAKMTSEDFIKIYLIYDEDNDVIKYSASRIYLLLRSAYPFVDKYGISNLDQLKLHVMESPEIAILLFNSTLNGVKVGDEVYSWKEFSETLCINNNIQYVLLLGNTYMMSEYKKTNWHYDEYEYTGITGAEVYAVWETSHILRTFDKIYNDSSYNMEGVAVKYYAENLNQIFLDNVQPTIVLGQKDPNIQKAKLQEYLSKHPDSMSVNIVKPEGVDNAPLLLGWKGVVGTGNDIDFMEIPVLSALKGPVGDFVDLVLEFLVGEGSDTLTINSQFITDFVNAFNAIKDFIGDPSVEGAGSLLKSFLTLLKGEFPYIENYTKYFDLFIDGFYALKGDLNHIVNFILEAIDLLFPEGLTYLDQLKSILQNLFSIGQDVLDQVGSITDLKMNVILNWLTSKLANVSIEKLVEDIPGVSNAMPLIKNLTSLFKIAIDLLSIGNVTLFVDKLYGFIVNDLKLISDPNVVDTMNKIKATSKLVLKFAQKDEDNIKTLLQEVILAFVDSSYISDIAEMVNKIIDEVDDAIKKAKTSITDFQTAIQNILNTYITGSGTDIEKAKGIILDTVTVITAISNPGFNVTDAKSVIEILMKVVDDYLPVSEADKQNLGLVLNATLLAYASLGSPSRVLKAFFKEVNPLKDYKQMLLNTLIDAAQMIIEKIDSSLNINDIINMIKDGVKVVNGLIDLIGEVRDRPFDGILSILMVGASYAPVDLFEDKLSIGNLTKILEVTLPDIMGLNRTPSLEEAKTIIHDALGALVSNSSILETLESIVEFMFSIREIVRDGVKWFTNKVFEWIGGKVSDFVSNLLDKLNSLIESFSFFNINGTMNLGIGGMDAISFKYKIAFKANINIDKTGLTNDIKDIIVKGKYYDLMNPLDTFWKLLKRLTITPTLESSLDLESAFSGKNSLLSKVLNLLGGASVNIEGGAKFKLELFSFKSGSFDMSNFMDLLEFSLRFKLEVSKTFTIFDIIGASTLGSIAEEVGLDGITVTLTFGFGIEITVGSGSEDGGDQSTLTVELTIAGTLHIGFDIVVASVSLDFTLTIAFRFTFDITSISIVFTIDITWKLKIHLEFLFVGKTFKFGGTVFTYTFPEPGEKPSDVAGGFDNDGDGLSDSFEQDQFGFAPNRTDTDLDGLDDNVELNGYGTDPLDPDTDGDGLNDYEEIYIYHTDPFTKDTDNDKLNDYLETKVYNTNPNAIDTDSDGLDDYFEVTHKWDISNVTISITGVKIGGKIYYDHTDPLNPDTDGDGLLDGQEGPMGGYYGDFLEAFGDHPIVFNYGYTHPLDNDTDDDSYLQYWDGRVHEDKVFLMSMTDKDEIDGITVVFIEDGEPTLKTFRTSPVCPDTDQDTASSAVILNSDSYELSLDPPSNPLNGDTDGDGLGDGYEGIGAPDTNKTDRNDPDTDHDGLGDLQEILLNVDPGNPDSDYDMVSDGEEFLKYGTNPRLADSDFDGLKDGEELFYWHSNPMLSDSDNDGISDGDEVLVYYTDPMDEDTDNDGLLDFEEIFVYHTNPFEADSDYDGLIDGAEVLIYMTDPLNWDTDGDSITYPNEYGLMTWPMSDGDEVLKYGTNPLFSDTDRDGISDSLELYLGSGLIPNFTAIHLDPLVNDTDGDGLMDGSELRIERVADIVYPYVSYNMSNPLDSSPVLYDTDSDGLNDFIEVNISSKANCNDTDGDGLLDGEEYYTYNTDPTYWDTDHDNVSDYDEIFGYNSTYYTKINQTTTTLALHTTDPLDNDTDDDFLPDGYEVFVVGTDPTKKDTDGDGIPDGNEFDSDGDGLTDGEEFFIYKTVSVPNGGPTNPDSDEDGLSDGSEIHTYGTDPANPDTDGDGYSDGAEVAAGTDPLEYTTDEDYNEAISNILGGLLMVVLTPKGEIVDRFTDVRVVNGTAIDEMWFRYRKNGEWHGNYTMTYDNVSKQWVYNNITWEPGTYTLEVFGRLPNGMVIKSTTMFQYEARPASNLVLWVAIGVAIGFVAALAIVFILPKILEKRRLSGKENVEVSENA
ncbi:MAG: hypothetical protein ACP6IP_06635 [Candidatus Njordarchaeia archaeon]